MEGKYFIKEHNEEINKHEHVIFEFSDGTDLRYHDTRKFGRMNLVKKDMLDTVSGVAKQGIEPIDDELSQNYLYDNFNKRRLPMKTLLLDQTIISGLGNIYADEVLFEAKINPLKKGNEISIEECERIKNASKKIIEEAIKCGGTTIKSYTSSLGVTGRFQQHLQVHKRENEKCNSCGTIINRIVVGGRSTYYCPKCQKEDL
jgi:formamidopyrimidine-DNA glycosylase